MTISRTRRSYACLVLAWMTGLVPTVSEATTSTSSASGTILICPQQDGPTLSSVGLTIGVTVCDPDGTPIEGYPFQDIWAGDTGSGDFNICPGTTVADANTNALGHTTISGSMGAGGCTQGVRVYLSGVPIGDVLPIDTVSPDLDKDLDVDAIDRAAMEDLYFSGNFEPCVDYYIDGDLNMADLYQFLEHEAHVCQ